MPPAKITDPWPLMRDVVTAVVNGLHRGRFIEDTLEALVRPAWRGLRVEHARDQGQRRSRCIVHAPPASRGCRPRSSRMHVTEVLSRVQSRPQDRRRPSARMPPAGSFVAVPALVAPDGLARGPQPDRRPCIIEFLPAPRATQATRSIEFVEMRRARCSAG